jgi:hypothetical protein
VNEGEAREEEQDTESLASVDDELSDEIQAVQSCAELCRAVRCCEKVSLCRTL